MTLLWSISSLEIPQYNIIEPVDEISLVNRRSIMRESDLPTIGIPYDINLVSSRNARKSELGPYKTSFLREIITSHKMGKSTGTKTDLVNTILNFHEQKSR